jgi:hypothetical protein
MTRHGLNTAHPAVPTLQEIRACTRSAVPAETMWPGSGSERRWSRIMRRIARPQRKGRPCQVRPHPLDKLRRNPKSP